MVKVMIADDEYFVREGIVRTVDWNRYGCILCGEAQDGCEGVEVAQRERPDLVITDIKMPGLDGLSMARKIKEFLPECRFIFITGYDEFSFAKDALRLSASDFLLKPIDEQEFLNAIQQAAKACMKADVIIDIARERVLLNMMRGITNNTQNGGEIAGELRDNYVNLAEIIIVLAQNDSYGSLVENASLAVLHRQTAQIKQLVRSVFPGCYTVECHEDILGMLIPAEPYRRSQEICGELRRLQANAKALFNISLTLGVSAINDIDNSSEGYSQGKFALKNSFYSGKGSITFFEDISRAENILKRDYILKEERELLFKVQACDRAAVEKQLHHLYFEVIQEQKIEGDTIKQVSIEIIIGAIGLLAELNIHATEVLGGDFDAYKAISGMNTIQDLHQRVQQTLCNVILAIRERAGSMDEGVEEALGYIRTHYREQLSLSQVASVVYLSESYLSRRIKKLFGITYVEYLTKLRMEQAMEALQNPNSKVGEVAEQLGYTDYRYFSGCFKRYTGYTPSEFSKKKNAQQDKVL